MPKYIVRPGHTVTHGSREQAAQHYSKLPPGTPFTSWPSPPMLVYGSGDEIEMTEEEAADAAHAVCTPEEWDHESSPEGFMRRGYRREDAERLAKEARGDHEGRVKARGKAMNKLPPLPLPPGVARPELAAAHTTAPHAPPPPGGPETKTATEDDKKGKKPDGK
jgi:hypothetical protein